jgi:hypothetical protein
MPKLSIPLECKSEEGVTVGIIDAILVLFNLLKSRLDNIPYDPKHPVIQALMDLEDDDNFEYAINYLNELRNTGILPSQAPTLLESIKASKRYCSYTHDYYGKPFSKENREAAKRYLQSLEEKYANGAR